MTIKNTQPKVYVLILNYCSAEDTIACVKSFRATNYSNSHLLVIDNASPDGSGQQLKEAIPPAEFIQSEKNIGYAGGNNEGMKIALQNNADYILIVNPDIRLPPEALQDYVGIMASDQSIAGLNSIQLQADNLTIDRNFSLGILEPNGFKNSTSDTTDIPSLFDSNMLFGAALMLSTTALRRVGGFDPLFFAYGEETDLCRRFRMHDYRLVVTTKSPVVHLRTVYTKPLSRRVLFLRLKGYYLSILKNPNIEMRKSFKRVYFDIKSALLGRAQNLYPYNTYSYDRLIVIKTLFWLLTFFPIAWLHKKKEKRGGQLYI